MGGPTSSMLSSGTWEFCPVPDVEVCWVDDPEWGSGFFFQPHVQATTASHFSQPYGHDQGCSHLVQVQSFLLPPKGPNPLYCCNWELVLPSLGPDHDHFYQAVVDWWDKKALSSQTVSFRLGPSPKFLGKILNSGTLLQAGEFMSDPILSMMALPLRLCVPSSNTIKFDFMARCKLADLLSVQNLLLFLKGCVGVFKLAALNKIQKEFGHPCTSSSLAQPQ